jgi:RNA recognition motif-containing protein
MITNLFVGGLPYETTQAELMQMFAACGKVNTVRLIMDGFTSRSKGFAFVEMSTEAEAQAAVAKLNGTAMGERQLCVSEARAQERRPEVPRGVRSDGELVRPDFVERRSGPKDRRRQQHAVADAPGPADKPRPKHKQVRPVRKPKDFGGRKKLGGKRARPCRRDARRRF